MTLTETTATATERSRPHVTVLVDRCAGCQECVIRCPTAALSMETVKWVAEADDAACIGCRQCVRTCPFSAIVVDGPQMVAARIDVPAAHPHDLIGHVGEIRRGLSTWDEALAEAARCLKCPDPTCVRGCPAHNDIPGFIGALRDGDLDAAHRVLRRTSVLPDICSRVCNQAAQCEGACTWSLAGGTPVAIGHLERFIADHQPVPPPEPVPASGALSVGIVGAGPAGAGAAWELVEAGASVTVYEKGATPGGLCAWGIPDFTLPRSVAARPWVQLAEAGVDVRCGTEVQPGMLDTLLTEHDALIVANGAGLALRLAVPGADLDGVTDATVFLQGAKVALEDGGDPRAFLSGLGIEEQLRQAGPLPPRVLVLGAGNTAMDVARTARRFGLQATCVDWLDERFALARPDEVAEARAEGVEVRFASTLTALRGDGGRVCRAELARTQQVRPDRTPKIVAGAPDVMSVDLVVMAMGYRVDPEFASTLPGTPLRRQDDRLPDRRWTASGILAAPASDFANRYPVGSLARGREIGLWAAALPITDRVWAAGDALVGPSTVVEAMSQGRRAAAAVLAAAPARRRGRAGRPQRVLVCYESRGGRTAKAAERVAFAIAGQDAQARVRVLPITKVGPAELAAADLVVVGTWVEGLVVAKVRPAKAMQAWLDRLPRLGGRPVAVFCTYAVAPKGAVDVMRKAFEARGAVVVADAVFSRGDIGEQVSDFGRLAWAAAIDDTEKSVAVAAS